MQKITKAKIKRDNLMDYIHEDRDLLMGLQDDLSDMLSATGKFSITLDEIVQNFMPFFPLYLIENEDEIETAFVTVAPSSSGCRGFMSRGDFGG